MSADRQRKIFQLARYARFQVVDVKRVIGSQCYKAALIKSRHLVNALEKLAELEDKELAESGIN